MSRLLLAGIWRQEPREEVKRQEHLCRKRSLLEVRGETLNPKPSEEALLGGSGGEGLGFRVTSQTRQASSFGAETLNIPKP